MMLQETELCLIVVTIGSFNQEGFYLAVGAEAFLINALIDSPDDKMNSLIIESDLWQFGEHQPPVWLE